MAKDFVANLIKHEEEFNFLSLEKLENIENLENLENLKKVKGIKEKK